MAPPLADRLSAPTNAQILARARSLRLTVLAKDFKVPLLPEVASDLFSLLLRPNLSLAELREGIESDPGIAARVVSLANSSMYSGGTQNVSSLRQATARLGMDLLRDILSQTLAEAYIFVGPMKARIKRLRVHSVVVAHLARESCRILRVEPDFAFMCGLFHDLGQLILYQLIADGKLGTFEKHELEPIAELLHPIVGERVCEKWKLPPETAAVARFHHYYGATQSDSSFGRMTSIVSGADRLAYHLNIGDRKLPNKLEDDPTWDILGFEPRHIDHLCEYTKQL